MAYKGTDAEKKAIREYQKKRDNIMIRPSKEEGEATRNAAAKAGKSVQAFILDILREYIK